MTTLFPVNKDKLSQFMQSLDETMTAHAQLQAQKYNFNFKEDKPMQHRSTATADFAWQPLTLRKLPTQPIIEPTVTSKVYAAKVQANLINKCDAPKLPFMVRSNNISSGNQSPDRDGFTQ